jgi:hypothetical protein
MLTTPGRPPPLPARVGSPNAEINSAVTQGFTLSGTLAQSVSVVRTTEKAIKDVLSGALPSPKPSAAEFSMRCMQYVPVSQRVLFDTARRDFAA